MNNIESVLGKSYPMAKRSDTHDTKERILLEATILFAQRGYVDVTMNDIAKTVGIKAASLYYHYESKEMLWEAVIDHVTGLYLMYFARLESLKKTVTSFEETLDTMFVELKEVVNIYTYYAFSIIVAEQFRDARAKDVFLNTFLKYSVEYIKGRFDECVEKEMVEPFDTDAVATFFMHSVLVGINIRVHEHMGAQTPGDVTEMFEGLQKYILSTTTPIHREG